MEANNIKKEISLNIKDIDTSSIKEQEQLLQDEAYSQLRVILTTKHHKIEKIDDILEHRSHNTIFIDGERGSGKTQFLLSIRDYLNKSDEDNEKISQNFYFFTPIDPTLLHDNESFLTIIIAKVLNNLERYGKLNDLNKREKKRFYRNLNNISEAIDGIVENKNKSSLEIIAQDQTSLKLEQFTHDFFKNVSDIVNRNRLILLIDDIDMAFDKGFEVLEVIRKYLATPYIIPIVTGHRKLYEYLIIHEFTKRNKMDKFMHNNEESKGVFKIEEYRQLIEGISTDYLIKVFPTNRRIQLKSLYDLYYDKSLIKNEIVLLGSSYHKTISDLFESMYQSKEFEILKEGDSFIQFKKNILKNSLRRLVQFFNANQDKELFGLTKIIDMRNIEKEFFLNILSDVDNFNTLLNGGIKLLAKSDNINAEKYFLRAQVHATTNKNKAIVYFYLGNNQAQVAEYIKAISSYKISLSFNDKDPDTHYKLAEAYSHSRNLTEAIDSIKSAIALEPHIIFYNQLSIFYVNNSQYKEAEETLEHIITLDDNPIDVFNNLGHVCIYTGKLVKARKYLKKAISINPDDFIPYINLMIILLIKNKYKKTDMINEFLHKFEANKEAMKFYSLFKLIHTSLSIEFKDLQDQVNIWLDEYTDIENRIDINLHILDDWINQQTDENKEKLLSIVDVVKQYI